jgi:hypothetical protein
VTRIVLYIISLVAGAITLPFLRNGTVPAVLISGIMIGIAAPLLDNAAANLRYFRLVYYSIRYPRKNIRISASYLFRVKVGNSYLLVKSRRWDHYQPVGGVYKTSAGAKSIMEEIGALDDDLVPIDTISLDDLRIRIPSSKLIRFMRWFESNHSRETSPWREFYEELIGAGILSTDDFPFIFHDFIRRHTPPIRFSERAQSLEIFIADIYELLPTQAQLIALQSLKASGHSDIIWATENQIRHLGVVPGEELSLRIGQQTTWTL